jgi:hypothetical protein
MKQLNKIMVVFLFLAVFAANANAQETQDNTRISVYLHPAVLLFSLNTGVPMIYSTVEIPFSLYNALIVKPSLWTSVKGKNELFDNVELFRLGSDVGFRHYPTGRGEGLYLQAQTCLHYLSIENTSKGGGSDPYDDGYFSDDDDSEKNSGKAKFSTYWYDFMGYLGWTYKFRYISIYTDTGLGYACVGGTKSNFNWSGGCTLMWDANLGIGVAF